MNTHFANVELPSRHTSSDRGWLGAGVAIVVLLALLTIGAWATAATDAVPDVIFVAVSVVFFVVSIGYVAACDRLMK